MAYEPKPGEGSLFQNKQPNRHEKAPSYKGYLITPDGDVVGLALWKIEGKNGTILSLKADDREGAYWAERMGRNQLRSGEDDNRVERRTAPRESNQQRGESRPSARDQRPSGGSRHNAQRSQPSGFSDDLDDEIPW